VEQEPAKGPFIFPVRSMWEEIWDMARACAVITGLVLVVGIFVVFSKSRIGRAEISGATAFKAVSITIALILGVGGFILWTVGFFQ
jgi:hypothetical protein